MASWKIPHEFDDSSTIDAHKWDLLAMLAPHRKRTFPEPCERRDTGTTAWREHASDSQISSGFHR